MIGLCLAIFALFLFSKLLASTLGLWIWEKLSGVSQKNNKSYHFDQLVESKKNLLLKRSYPTTPSHQTLHRSSLKKDSSSPCDHISPIYKKYHDRWSRLSQKKHCTSREERELKQLQLLTSLFNSLEWGTGKEIRNISQKISQDIGTRIEESELVSIIKHTLKAKSDPLVQSNNHSPLDQFIYLWESYLFWEKLRSELSSGKGRLIKVLQSQYYCSSQDLTLAALSLFHKIQGISLSPSEILRRNNPLPSQEKIQNLSFHAFFSKKTKSFRTQKQWREELKEEAFFYSCLSPLKSLKNDRDKVGARKILEVKETAPFEEVKKNYKKFAQLKHPDKLASKGIPPEFESIATENFSLIQRAYQILKNEYKI